MLPAKERHCPSLRSLPNALPERPLSRPRRGCRKPELSLAPLGSRTRPAAEPHGTRGSRNQSMNLAIGTEIRCQEFLCPDGWKAGKETGRGWRLAPETALGRGGWAGARLNHIFTAGEGFMVEL